MKDRIKNRLDKIADGLDKHRRDVGGYNAVVNKILVIILIGLVTVTAFFTILLSLTGCSGNTGENAAENSAPSLSIPRNAEDALRFKLEHEAFNDIKGDDGNLRHMNIYIPADNTVIYLEFEQVMEFFDSGTGIFMFSRPT